MLTVRLRILCVFIHLIFPTILRESYYLLSQCITEEIGDKEIKLLRVTHLVSVQLGSHWGQPNSKPLAFSHCVMWLKRIYKGLIKDLEILLQFLSLFGFCLMDIYKSYPKNHSLINQFTALQVISWSFLQYIFQNFKIEFAWQGKRENEWEWFAFSNSQLNLAKYSWQHHYIRQCPARSLHRGGFFGCVVSRVQIWNMRWKCCEER